MTAEDVREALREFRAQAEGDGSTEPCRPGDRIPFHWPPHPVSREFRVRPADWREEAWLEIDDERSRVQIAMTPNGVFGRSERYWHDARGTTIDEVLVTLREKVEPLLERQKAIAETLGWSGRYTATIRELGPIEWVMLLYCPLRDIGHEAMVEIEAHASSGLFSPALVDILNDQTHPWRRCAHWCVLDMFEDLPSFCPDPAWQREAITAIRNLIWRAPDDHARVVYKAGVVLGGHICTDDAAAALLECMDAPHPVGRRSAIHAVFHLAEWRPDDREMIVRRLREHAAKEEVPELRRFARDMAEDVQRGGVDHVAEPRLAGE